jgi:hypothetical protein
MLANGKHSCFLYNTHRVTYIYIVKSGKSLVGDRVKKNSTKKGKFTTIMSRWDS